MLRQIKNFIKWGWRCKDVYEWDYAYLIQIMLFQLKDMEEHLRTSGLTVGSTKRAKEIARAIRLIEDSIEDNYYTREWEELEAYKEKHDTTDSCFAFSTRTELEDGNIMYESINTREANVYSNRFIKLMEKCAAKADKDFSKALLIIDEKHKGWWD